MRKYLCYYGLFLALLNCKKQTNPIELNTGIWQAELCLTDGKVLPFNFNLYKTASGSYQLDVLNAQEKIVVDEIVVDKDSIRINAPVFDGYIAGVITPNSIVGRFNIESMDRSLPFSAVFNVLDRFSDSQSPEVNVSGTWETEFGSDTTESYWGKGTFTQNKGKVTGTFRTSTGDYRFLEGVMDKDSLKLSAFDGAHAFLFLAKATDSVLNGMFYSGRHFKTAFKAKRNEGFELPSPDSLTFIKRGYDRFNFSFPDSQNRLVSLSDEEFQNKVIIVQLMGTWCPNCLDETKFLVNYKQKNDTKNLKVIALAFEYAKTEKAAMSSIERLKERIGVTYPVLLAQYGSSNKEKAQEKLPMLNHVLSYPTTIFIDKKGQVRRIHTGFNGPATGDTFVAFKEDFNNFVTELLEE
jgi:thiol-disulfide isomerase/thioredoxin